MSLGNEWKKSLGIKGMSEKERVLFEKEKRRTEVLAALPEKMRRAIAEKQECVVLYGWITQEDVHGGDVDEFWRRGGRTRPLIRDEVSGIARDVVEWCDQNGIKCYMEDYNIPMNDNEYNLVARP